LGSVSRQTIYRVKSPIQRVHKAEFSRAWAAMQEIADWLTRLGLPEYAGAFAENGIDVAVLPHLTDQDLKDIGVLLAHRRKILVSPSASRPFLRWRRQGTATRPNLSTGAGRAATNRSHGGASACHGDVLHLVDSTGVAAKLDAEEWRDFSHRWRGSVGS
jgi:SAM domain (Sterile alpha motif)